MRHWPAQWQTQEHFLWKLKWSNWKRCEWGQLSCQPLSDSSLLILPMEREAAVMKYKFWGTKSTETPKLSLCYLALTQRNNVLFLAVKVSEALVFSLDLFTDMGVRIECTVLNSQYWLSHQPKLLLFSVLFPPSPLQISGNLTVPWITGCSRKRAVSTFPLKYLMHQVKQWKVDKNAFLKMSVLFTLGEFFPFFLWYKHFLQVQCFSWGEVDV